jgi:hypothetical protein
MAHHVECEGMIGMRQYVEFNINDHVWVRLKDEGRDIIRRHHDEIYARLEGRIGKPHPARYADPVPTEDSEGWSRWQMWDLMATFGPHISHSATPPFDMLIRIKNG